MPYIQLKCDFKINIGAILLNNNYYYSFKRFSIQVPELNKVKKNIYSNLSAGAHYLEI